MVWRMKYQSAWARWVAGALEVCFARFWNTCVLFISAVAIVMFQRHFISVSSNSHDFSVGLFFIFFFNRLLQKLWRHAALSWYVYLLCIHTRRVLLHEFSNQYATVFGGWYCWVICTIDNLLGTNQMICFISDWITIKQWRPMLTRFEVNMQNCNSITDETNHLIGS